MRKRWSQMRPWRGSRPIASGRARPGSRVLALYDGAGTVRLTALSGDVPSDRDLELWAIQGGNDPISMGVIPVNERSVVELSEQVRAGWGEGSVLAITLEPKGGAPEGKATGPVVALGEVHQI